MVVTIPNGNDNNNESKTETEDEATDIVVSFVVPESADLWTKAWGVQWEINNFYALWKFKGLSREQKNLLLIKLQNLQQIINEIEPNDT